MSQDLGCLVFSFPIKKGVRADRNWPGSLCAVGRALFPIRGTSTNILGAVPADGGSKAENFCGESSEAEPFA